MTRKLITLTAAAGIALGGWTYLQAQDPSGPSQEPKGRHHHGPGLKHRMENPFDRISETLDLTPEQKARVQPIVDQMKPQLKAIHEEAMERMRTLMEGTGAQIRPLLTPPQQEKFDALKKAHENMRKAMQEMHDAKEK